MPVDGSEAPGGVGVVLDLDVEAALGGLNVLVVSVSELEVGVGGQGCVSAGATLPGDGLGLFFGLLVGGVSCAVAELNLDVRVGLVVVDGAESPDITVPGRSGRNNSKNELHVLIIINRLQASCQ